MSLSQTTQIEHGVVTAVELETLGATITVDYPSGVVVLPVSDTRAFNAAGGSVTITSYPSGVQTINHYDYSAVDFDNSTITLTQGLANATTEGDWVAVSPMMSEKIAMVHVTDDQPPIKARILHNLTDRLEDGIRATGSEESCTVELWKGTWWLTDLHGADPVIASAGYIEGEAGYRLGGGIAQFENGTAIGEWSAGRVNADELVIAGADFNADILPLLPRGLVSYVKGSGLVNTASVSAETIGFIIDHGGPFYASRAYRVTYRFHLTSAVTVGDRYETKLRTLFSTLGSGPTAIPTLSSAIWDYSRREVAPGNSGERPYVNHEWVWIPPVDYDNVKSALTMVRNAGTGLIQIKNDDPNFGMQVWVEDIGAAGVQGGTLSQKSKSAGTADPDPVASYTKTWAATSNKMYKGDNTLWTTNGDIYQGVVPGYEAGGNTKSMVAYNDSDIRSKTAGSTILRVQLTFKIIAAADVDGMTVNVVAHNATTLPATYTALGSPIATRANSVPGGTYTIDLPVSFGQNLRDGTARGIAFAIAASDGFPDVNSGRLYGFISGQAPSLTITYSK